MNRMILGIVFAPFFLLFTNQDTGIRLISPPEVLEKMTQKVRSEVPAWFWDPSVDMTGTLRVEGRHRVRGRSLPQPFIFRVSFAYRCTGETMLRFGDETDSLIFCLQGNKISVYDFKEKVYTFLEEETLGEVLPLLLKDIIQSKFHIGGNGIIEKLQEVFSVDGDVTLDDEAESVHVRSCRKVRSPRRGMDYLLKGHMEISRKTWLPLRVELVSGKSDTRDLFFEMHCDAGGHPREFKLEKRESWRVKYWRGKMTFDPVGRLTGMNMEVSNPPTGDCTLILDLDRNKEISEFLPPTGFRLVDFDIMIQRLPLRLEILKLMTEWAE